VKTKEKTLNALKNYIDLLDKGLGELGEWGGDIIRHILLIFLYICSISKKGVKCGSYAEKRSTGKLRVGVSCVDL